MLPVNLCNSADLHVKLQLSQDLFGRHSFVWLFLVTHTWFYRCSWSRRNTEQSFQPGNDLKPHGCGGRRDGIDISLNIWLYAFRSVWYYRWTGTRSGVVCPLLTLRVCQRCVYVCVRAWGWAWEDKVLRGRENLSQTPRNTYPAAWEHLFNPVIHMCVCVRAHSNISIH